MTERPQVTVLMTVFNTQAYLAEAIESILHQTFTDFELIIVDDCSTDGSWSMISTAASRDSRIVPIRRATQGGASSGLNDGLNRARGNYITRQDSDDVSLPDRLAEQVAFLERNPQVGAVGTPAVLIDSDGRPCGTFHCPEADSDIQEALLDYMCFCGPNVMVRRSVFEKVGLGFDETLSGSEDYDLCLRLSEAAALANLKQPLYLYRHHPSSVSYSQRYAQLHRKASALEKAVRRRFGANPTGSELGKVPRDYFRAAVIAHAMDQPETARDCVAKVISLNRTFLENPDLVEESVRRCTPSSAVSAALAFTTSLFDDVLPRTRRLDKARRRLVADLHMQAVFAAASQGESAEIERHLWPGIRNNPAWLANRGVVSLLVRQALIRA